MGNKTNTIKTNIEFNGIPKFAEVNAAIKQIRDKINKTSNTTLLGNVDKEIKKIEDLSDTLRAQLEKGFSSSKDINSFNSNISKLEVELQKLENSFKDIGTKDFKKKLDDLNEELKKAKDNAKELSNDFKKAFTDASSGAKGSFASSLKNDIADAVKESKNLEEVQNSINQKYEKQSKIISDNTKKITKQKEALQSQLESLKSNTNLSLTSADLRNTKKNDSIFKVGLQTSNFKDLVSDKKISGEQLNTVRAGFEKIIVSAKSAAEAINNFDAFLKQNNMTAANSETVANKVKEAYSRQTEAMSDYQSRINTVNNEFKKIITTSKNSTTAAEKFLKVLREQNLAAENSESVINKVKTAYDNYKNGATTLTSQIRLLDRELKNNEEAEKRLSSSKETILNALISLAKEYNAAANAAERYNKINASYANDKEQLTKESKEYASSLEDIITLTSQYVGLLKQDAQAGKQVVDTQNQVNSSLDALKSRIGYVLSLGNAYYQVRSIISQTYQDINNLDKAFASIAMVTDKTVSQLWDTYSDYTDIANRLGQTSESAIKASALYYQQGLDTADALKLTEDTMKLATLAGADFETATKQMTAALRAFNMEMDQGAHITDVYSELAANAAADVNGIAYAMSKTASIAASAGMSFENTAAFITNVIETTQEAPSKQKLIY